MSFKIVYDDGDVTNNPAFSLSEYLLNHRDPDPIDYYMKCRFVPADAKIGGL